MIKKGSLVRFEGKSRVIPSGKHLLVHEVKDDKAVVWILGNHGFVKKAVPLSDLRSVNDPPEDEE